MNEKASESYLVTKAFTRDVRKAFNDQAERFGVRASDSGQDDSLHLMIEATHSTTSGGTRSCLALLTLFIIPNYTKYELALQGRLTQKDRLVKRYEAHGEYAFRTHLLLLNPFRWRLTAGKVMAERTFECLFVQVQSDALKGFE